MLPGIEQIGSSEKVKSVPIVQVTWLLPSFTASELEHVTSTTAPVSTGNCDVVSIVLVHSVFSPVHIGAAEVFNLSEKCKRLKCRNKARNFFGHIHKYHRFNQLISLNFDFRAVPMLDGDIFFA